MKRADEIKRLVRETSFNASAETDEMLRASIAQVGRTSRTTSAPERQEIRRPIMKISATRIAIAALVCIVIGAGAVVGVNVGQYFYMGRDDDHHHFISDDGQSVVTMDDEDVPDVEQARSDLQEMKALSEQGQREVIRVIEIRANDHLERRLFVYRYHLSDGRTRQMGEAAPGNTGQWTLPDAPHDEAIQLKKAGPGEALGTYEDEVMGRTFVFQRQRYVLSDGTEIIWSVGEPKAD